MQTGLKGKRALVTGASAGLGAAAAMALASEGVELVINSRSRDKLQATADRIEQATGVKPGLAVGDLADQSERVKVILAAREQLRDGSLDILVSNTGGPPPGAFLDHSGEAWADAGKLLLDSAVGLTRAFLPGMLEQKWGRLIYITSIAVLQPVDELILSNAYRAGVTGFCKTVSNTYAGQGITVNCVCPGYTATERLINLAKRRAEQSGGTAEDVIREMAAEIPVGRIGKPEELAALIVFLASDNAAYITGTSIPVDGGLHKGLL
jgi:3-oxoacyl-[acyl-carrier protein] reductase